MALARWQATIVNDSGDIVPLAFIEVREEVPGQPLRQVYSDRDGLVALGNPFQADAEGFAYFHAPGGAYQIRAYTGPSGAPTFERIWRYVGVATSQEFDVNFDGSVLEVESFWPQYVVETVAELADYDGGPVFDDQGRRLSVLVTADSTNLSDDSPPAALPTLYFLLEAGSPGVWSQGFTFPAMVPELDDGSFTGDGVTTAFDLGVMVQDARYVLWVEDGIVQRAGIDFTTSGTILTRTTAPLSGAVIWWVRTVVNDITGLGSGLNAKVNKAGDTMTGALVLAGNAANPLEAVPKQQLDASIATEVTNRNAAIDAAVVGLFDDRGSYDASPNTFPASGGSGTAGAIKKGDIWLISVAGTLGGSAVEIGDQVRALVDTPGQTAGNWAISQAQIVDAVTKNATQTLTNKTLTAPVINSPTGIVKGDVGLGNVDNTSDADKPVSTAQATADALAIPKLLLTTRGDIIFRNATVPDRLPKGTAGQVLTMGADDPGWATPSSGSWLGGFKNLLLNPDGRFNQRAPATNANNTYGHDRWVALTQTSTIAVSTLIDQESGMPRMWRLTQSQAVAQRMGYAQWLEGASYKYLRGQQVTLSGRIRFSLNAPVRYAICEWTGTSDLPGAARDIVNDWTNGTFTAGQFFKGTTFNVLAVGTITPAAATFTDLTALTATVGASANNVVVFFWTEGTAAQNATLDATLQLEVGAAASAREFRPYAVEHAMLTRYCQIFDGGAQGGQHYPVAAGAIQCISTTAVEGPIRVVPWMRVTPSVTFSGQTDFELFNSAGGGLQTTAISFLRGTNFGIVLQASVASGLVAGDVTTIAAFNGSAKLTLDAEI